MGACVASFRSAVAKEPRSYSPPHSDGDRASAPPISTPAVVAGTNLFFFSSRRRHTRFDCDWSSDVCSSDLEVLPFAGRALLEALAEERARRRLEPPAERRGEERRQLGRREAPVGLEPAHRSEERRVGKEGRSRWSPDH